MVQIAHRALRAVSDGWDGPEVARVLRVHDEPCVHVGDWAVHRALTADPAGYLRHLRARLAEIAAGERRLELSPKTIFSDGDGDFRVMPCVTGSGRDAVKTVKVVGTNLRGEVVPDQITVGRAVRLHPLENFVTHLFDACVLSSARTGACAALAVDLLAPAARSVALVGAGRVAFYGALYLSAASEDLRLVVTDGSPGRADALVAALRSGGVAAGARPFAAAVADADAVVLATTSRTVLLAPADTRARCVVSMGADAVGQHELAPDWTQEAAVYADCADAREVGDLRAWEAAGLLAAPPPTLLDLLRTPRLPPRRSVFVSSGSALFDNLTIEYLLDAPGAGMLEPADDERPHDLRRDA
ncbi:MAG TPA: hypothetical protein VFA05_09330 [Gaiellaceae bacterium]|nr:hypothetical protein [Gaiellaceae bacterium]